MNDEKLEFMKEQMKKSERELVFCIYKDEYPTLEEWLETHECEFTEDPLKAGPIGGRLSYRFTPTGLGQVTVVACLCGEEINITNFDCW